MGLLFKKLKIRKFGDSDESVTLEFLLDSGAIYSLVPNGYTMFGSVPMPFLFTGMLLGMRMDSTKLKTSEEIWRMYNLHRNLSAVFLVLYGIANLIADKLPEVAVFPLLLLSLAGGLCAITAFNAFAELRHLKVVLHSLA